MASLDTSSDKVNTRSSSAKRKADTEISPNTLKNQKKKAAKKLAAQKKREMAEEAGMDFDASSSPSPSSQEIEQAEAVLSALTVAPVPNPPPCS